MSDVQNHCTPGHGTLPDQPNAAHLRQPSPPVPHTCPVCSGRGFVAAGFYSTTGQTGSATGTGTERCRTCYGAGIVWETRQEYVPTWTYWPGFVQFDTAAAPPIYTDFTMTIRNEPNTYQTYQSADAGGGWTQ